MKHLQTYSSFLKENQLSTPTVMEKDEFKGKYLDQDVDWEITSAILTYTDEDAAKNAKTYLNIDMDSTIARGAAEIKKIIRSLLNKTDSTSYSYTMIPNDMVDFESKIKGLVGKELDKALQNLPWASKQALKATGSIWKDEYLKNNQGPDGAAKKAIDAVLLVLDKQRYQGDIIQIAPPPPISFNAASSSVVDLKNSQLKIDTKDFRQDGKGYLRYKIASGQNPEKDIIGGLGNVLQYRYKVVSPGAIQLYASEADLQAGKPIKLTSLGKGTQSLVPQPIDISPFKIKVGNSWKQYGTVGYAMWTGYYFDAILDALKTDSTRFSTEMVNYISKKIFGS